jgi:hypothetical protein
VLIRGQPVFKSVAEEIKDEQSSLFL